MPKLNALTLKNIRESKGLTQRQLAHTAGLAHAQVTRLESDPTVNPTLSTLNKLNKGLGLSNDDLILLKP